MHVVVDLYRCDIFYKIKSLLASITFVSVIKSDAVMKGDYFVNDKDIECSIYCQSDIIKEIFKLDTGCILEIRSDAMTDNRSRYCISDLYHILKKSGNGKEYYEFKYTVKSEILDKFMDRVHRLYVCLYVPMEGYISTSNISGLMVSPKTYSNTKSLNHTVSNHISKVFKQLCNDTDEYERERAFKLLAAFESYFCGKLKHDKYKDILHNYAQSIYGIDENISYKYLSQINDADMVHSGISALCSLCTTIGANSLKKYIYEIILFITNDELLSKRIMDNPLILVKKNVKYDMSRIWLNIKRMVNLYINIDNRKKMDVYNIIDTLDGLKKELSGNN